MYLKKIVKTSEFPNYVFSRVEVAKFDLNKRISSLNSPASCENRRNGK